MQTVHDAAPAAERFASRIPAGSLRPSTSVRLEARWADLLEALRDDIEVETPPLIRGYLRCGAELLGPPARDPEFGTAELPMLLALDGLPRRHRRHLLGELDASAARLRQGLSTSSSRTARSAPPARGRARSPRRWHRAARSASRR